MFSAPSFFVSLRTIFVKSSQLVFSKFVFFGWIENCSMEKVSHRPLIIEKQEPLYLVRFSVRSVINILRTFFWRKSFSLMQIESLTLLQSRRRTVRLFLKCLFVSYGLKCKTRLWSAECPLPLHWPKRMQTAGCIRLYRRRYRRPLRSHKVPARWAGSCSAA